MTLTDFLLLVIGVSGLAVAVILAEICCTLKEIYWETVKREDDY